ncbi:MAG: Sensor histidine kinase [Myxococcaceae bacterium]|nr:Sensor histidine kinase [Myxococcaceae bacterium]
MARRTRSVRTQVVAGFATLIVAFGAVAGWSLYRQQRTVRSLRVANEVYLQLTSMLGEDRGNQSQLATVLDRLVDERDRVGSQAFIAGTRRSRRGRLAHAQSLVQRGLRLALDTDDRRLLEETARSLLLIDRLWSQDEPLFDGLLRTLTGADLARARQEERELLSREDQSKESLSRMIRALQARVKALSDGAERQQAETLRLTVTATAVACLLGVLTTLRARRALDPLARLRDRAQAVARGELGTVQVPAAEDEIGELAVEFERMVGAMGLRDVALREANEKRLQAERLAAVGRMAAHVTHEVRNPLSSMALNAEMLGDELDAMGEPGSESRRLVRSIQREIDRLSRLTEEYLRVARLPTPRLQREDLATLVEETLQFVTQEMSVAGVGLGKVLEEGVPAVRADESQLRQAMLNLLRNAREAMELAGVSAPRVVVRVTARAEAGVPGAAVCVSDSGPGLSDEARAHLFELFFTTKARGSGLGLSLTREIAIAHGGSLHAERAAAADGGGARFVLWLPAAADDGAHEGASDAEGR